VFVNPARAAFERQRFVYGTLRRTGAGEPVSFAGLFGRRDRRWLVTAENRIFTRDNTDRETDVTLLTDEPTGQREFDRVSEFSNAIASTRIRALLVSRTDFGGYALGVFGGYRASRDRSAQTSTQTAVTTSRPPFSVFTQTQRRVDDNLRRWDQDDLGVGAEVAFAGRMWDLAAAVSYQRRMGETVQRRLDLEASTAEIEGTSDDVPAQEESVRNRSEQRIDQAIDGTPSALDIDVVASLRAGADRPDYLFVAASGTVGSGDAEYRYTFLDEEEFVREVGGVVVQEQRSSESFDDAGKVALSAEAAEVSLGYVYVRRPERRRRRGPSGMTILAAVNPRGEFARTETATADFGGNLRTSSQETAVTSLALELPLYVRFGVTERLDAFGGGSFTYAYERRDIETQLLLPDDPDDNRTDRITRERVTDQFSSQSRLYAGAVFSFRSGLTAQATFRGNLAELTRWAVSLGYRF
jgi:hypothetical protein